MDAATSINLALRRKQVAFWAQKSHLFYFFCDSPQNRQIYKNGFKKV